MYICRVREADAPHDSGSRDTEVVGITAGKLQFGFSEDVGIPVKVNIDSGGKPNGIPERR